MDRRQWDRRRGLMGAAPTGRAVQWDGVTIVRLKRGKIAEIRTVADVLGLRQQLGLE